MIGDKETQKLAKQQVFQWFSMKVVIFKDGKILLGKRLDTDDYGLWEIPGGKAEVGEDLKEAAIREVKEEVGLDVDVNMKPFYLEQNLNKNIAFVVLRADIIGGELLGEMEEMSDIGFYSKDQVQRYLEDNKVRKPLIKIAKMFVNGEFDG